MGIREQAVKPATKVASVSPSGSLSACPKRGSVNRELFSFDASKARQPAPEFVCGHSFPPEPKGRGSLRYRATRRHRQSREKLPRNNKLRGKLHGCPGNGRG